MERDEPTTKYVVLGFAWETFARMLAYWLPKRWRARLDLAGRRTVRRALRWVPIKTLLHYWLMTRLRSFRHQDAERRARLREKLGREPTEDEVRAAWQADYGLDAAACPIPNSR